MMRIHQWKSFVLILAVLTSLAAREANAVRIKDICGIEGVRENQLVGYGLVIGLNGTGDSDTTEFTRRSLTSFLRRQRNQVNPDDITVDNVAAVLVTATLPPFSRQGMQIDVTVSSLGDAENLQGGTLIATPLRPVAADVNDPNQIYAVAQGTISTGGYAVGTGGQASIVKNHLTVATIPNGAIVERAVASAFATKPEINLLLRNPDFTTAMRIAGIINAAMGPDVAQATNSAVVTVQMPKGSSEQRVSFVAEIETLNVSPDSPARVVYNERTGTIVMGANVRISEAIITHGNLVLEQSTEEQAALVQMQNLTGQSVTTIETENTEVEAREEQGEFRLLEEGVTIGELARALNALGVSARDIISILQALKEAGALQAELVAM